MSSSVPSRARVTGQPHVIKQYLLRAHGRGSPLSVENLLVRGHLKVVPMRQDFAILAISCPRYGNVLRFTPLGSHLELLSDSQVLLRGWVSSNQRQPWSNVVGSNSVELAWQPNGRWSQYTYLHYCKRLSSCTLGALAYHSHMCMYWEESHPSMPGVLLRWGASSLHGLSRWIKKGHKVTKKGPVNCQNTFLRSLPMVDTTCPHATVT